MNKILLVYMDMPDFSILDKLVKIKDTEIVQILEHSCENKVDSDNKYIFIDFNDEKDLKVKLKDIFPVGSILFIPSIDLNGNYEEKARVFMEKVFIILKQFYAPIMRLKGVSLWILEPVIPDGINEEIKAVYHSINAGLKAFSRVLGMELARKKVTVNYLADYNSFQGVENLVDWVLMRKDIFMTARIIND